MWKIMTIYHLEKKCERSKREESLKESMESLPLSLPSYVEFPKSDLGSFSSTVWALVSSIILGLTHTVLYSFLPHYKSKKANVSAILTQHASPNFPVSLLDIFVVCSVSSFH